MEPAKVIIVPEGLPPPTVARAAATPAEVTAFVVSVPAATSLASASSTIPADVSDAVGICVAFSVTVLSVAGVTALTPSVPALTSDCVAS